MSDLVFETQSMASHRISPRFSLTPFIPNFHHQGMTHGPHLKNIVFNFLYSSSPSIWYATWPCLTKLDFWPPISPKYHPQGMTHGPNLKKILYLISSTLQALRFDMLHDHVWQNWTFDSPKYHPQGMTHWPNLKNIVFNTSTLQALRFDMLHDHVWQNWILDPPNIPQVPPPGHDPCAKFEKYCI